MVKKHLSWIVLGILFIAVSLWGGLEIFLASRDDKIIITEQGTAGPQPGQSGAGERVQRSYYARSMSRPSETKDEEGPGRGSAPVYESAYGKLPESLRDTEIPDGLRIDGKGELVIDRDVRDVFDFFMSGLGEEPRDVVLGRIREHIGHKLEGGAAARANKILDDYLAYKDYLATERRWNRIGSTNTAGDRKAVAALMREMFEDQVEERRRFLGKEAADAFFASDELNDREAISHFESGSEHD